MAVDTRRCFWFGTEDRAGWFATPLQGAESSPEGWSADGTLLNGGAYGLHSWGSHKRYTYEWPQSSSPETAQMMKSYRDGTYGRGLLYFLEPGIYRTNVLPAHWADPSMSLDNEAPSLVYNVDPTPVATSGGSTNNLPVTSARYDLSTVEPATIPTPDSSVFLPVPQNHTLFLGAFYTASGSAGVFATPINNNGTFGTTVRLTEKSNLDSDVVTDQFSGDIRGVRLWIGREDSTPSLITVAAMSGRLLHSSDVATYGPWVTYRTNLHPDPAMTSLAYVTETPSQATVSVVPTGVRWTLTTTAAVGINMTTPLTLGENYRLLIRVRANRSLSATPRIRGTGVSSGPVTLTTSWQWIDVTGTAGGTAVSTGFLLSSGHAVSDWVEVSNILVATSPDSGDWFSGSTVSSTPDTVQYIWSSAPNSSSSFQQTRTSSGSPSKQTMLMAGPWIGGQGHSGCRFLGTPSYVTNSPIEGGRIGFAASFIEVGSWVYG